MSSSARSLPKNYRLIYEIVSDCGRGRHLTPAEVYAAAAQRRPGIGLTTVYRGLERLRDLGLLSEIHVPGVEAANFELAGPNHAHLRCTKCGAIADVEFELPARTIKALAARHGFCVEGERVTFEGYCASCNA